MATTISPSPKVRSLKNFVSQKFFVLALCASLGFVLWRTPAPAGISVEGWKVVSVFAFTLLSMILKPISIGMTTLMSLGVLITTGVLTFGQAFQGFTNEVVWLVVFAFFIARGFIKTGLGLRIAYMMMSRFGSSSLGMAYSLGLTEFVLGSAIPSVTARAGGVIYPVVSSLSRAFDSDPVTSPRKIGAFLMATVFQLSSITSAMFLTGMAGNPMAQALAREQGVNITWGSWFITALVPGIVSLSLLPLIIYKFYPPEIKKSPETKTFAVNKLKELGPMKKVEWLMISVFALMITLWVLAPVLHVSATIVALLGLAILVLSNVITWDDVLKENSAWDTLIWFSALLVLAGSLTRFGVMGVFSDYVARSVGGYPWYIGFSIVAVVYFYAHYFFASNAAHISAMFAPFLLVSISIGTPPVLAAMVLCYFSALFGCLTTYGTGHAPIYFGSGYVAAKDWWRVGFIVSLFHLAIWFTVGAAWWKVLGLY